MEDLAMKIGLYVARLHDCNSIHGDLTTSNILMSDVSIETAAARTSVESLFLIDFGLSGKSDHAEDKAVDLYVLERAVMSTHPTYETFFTVILEGYKQNSKRGDSTIKKLG